MFGKLNLFVARYSLVANAHMQRLFVYIFFSFHFPLNVFCSYALFCFYNGRYLYCLYLMTSWLIRVKMSCTCSASLVSFDSSGM